VSEDQERAHGPWIIQAHRQKYTSEFVTLEEDRVRRPDGTPGTYATVALKPGVAMLPIDEHGDVYLTKQFRYAIGRGSVEVPSGSVEPGEEPLAAGQRELKEELGIDADEWIDLGVLDLDTSIVRCPVRLLVARSLRFAAADQDPSEVIRPLKASFEGAVDMVMDSQITHAPSCALILKASHYLVSGKWPS
jgi:8-oxo-dGTP pyrophosphatase MutT (NUDIX family)